MNKRVKKMPGYPADLIESHILFHEELIKSGIWNKNTSSDCLNMLKWNEDEHGPYLGTKTTKEMYDEMKITACDVVEDYERNK